MLKRFFTFFLYGTFDKSTFEGIEGRRGRANKNALRFVSFVTIILVAILSVMAITLGSSFNYTLNRANLPIYYISIILSLIMLILSHILRSNNYYLNLVMIYIQVGIIYLLGIYLGTSAAPSANAVIFAVMLVAMSMLINDHPYRINLLSLLMYLLFLYWSHEIKGTNFFRTDMINGMFSLIISTIVCIFIEHLRLSDWRSTRALNRKQAELLELSRHDGLTGLYNRRALDEFLSTIYNTDQPVALIMSDLNGLKSTNDSLGHNAGDDLILRAVKLLSTDFNGQHLYRMGGDEFLAIVIGDTEESVNKKIVDFKSHCEKQNVSMAVGMNYVNPPFTNYEEYIRVADELMYRDKSEYYKKHDRRKR